MADTRTAQRHLVETYTSYPEAERAVDRLSDDGFPVERLTIVAEGLSLVENVTGRRSYLDAAAGGTVTGGVIGALLGFVFGVFSWVDPLVSGLALAVYGLVVGAVVGLVLGLLGHWMMGGRRDFSSSMSLGASRYDVVADDAEVAEEAARRLGSIDLG
ncbi:MAG TPA: general stress protein, partial [Acidimicrobiales bacterium]|nr:general stress protein [Acidimicrobiales bacterium]